MSLVFKKMGGDQLLKSKQNFVSLRLRYQNDRNLSMAKICLRFYEILDGLWLLGQFGEDSGRRLIIVMKNQRSSYKKIDEEKRLQIIDKIINRGEQLKSVAEETGVNISTCKAIIKVYQEEGRVGKKQKRNKTIEVVETYSFYCLEGGVLKEICPLQIESAKISVPHQEGADDLIAKMCEEKSKEKLKELQDAPKVQKKLSTPLDRKIG